MTSASNFRASTVLALLLVATPGLAQDGEPSADGSALPAQTAPVEDAPAPPESPAAALAMQRELEASTVPSNRSSALALPVEVLEAQLRPLTLEQVSTQLSQWLSFLQRTCLEVRNVEVSSIQSEDPRTVEAFNARAVALRGERAGLIKRVEAVIDALERKGGDAEEARSYVRSVVAKPPIAGARAAWATARAWLTDKEGGIAMAISGSTALAILVAFWVLAKVLSRIARRATRSLPHASELLREFLIDSVRRLTILIGALIALSTLGLNMTPLVAAIGAAGLVIGLALQGTLGNIASGLMIMIYRPFDVGDAVQMAGVSGKVHGMTLMTTTVRTFDNQTTHVPNNKIWGDVITNVTANPTRRIDMIFGISYDDDVARAKEVLERIVSKHAKVLADPEPTIRLHELGDSSVNLIVRPWANTPDYWDVYWDVTEEVKRTFDAEGITIPFPQRDVHLLTPHEAGERTVTLSRATKEVTKGSNATT
jgi:small conductance mechanosensitive channel